MNTIKNLAVSNLKKNRTRSILILTAIFLTTVMLTMIAGTGYALVRLNQVNAANWYGSYHGSYQNVGEDVIREMSLRSEFSQIGKTAAFGMVDADSKLFLSYMDHQAMEMTNADGQLTDGHFPEKGNEIAGQPTFFKALGVTDPKVGSRVEISYRTDLKSQFEPAEFIICGLLWEPDITDSSMAAYASQEFFESAVPPEQRSYSALFYFSDDLSVNAGNGEAIMKEIAEKCGIPERDVSPNLGYLSWGTEPDKETIAACVAIAAVVILFSVIVIYNIVQVGIVERVQDYGRIKAVGATEKQLRKLVWREGIYLAVIGIPSGLVVGLLSAHVGFRWMRVIMNENADGRVTSLEGVSVFSFPLLLLIAVVSLFTVWLAMKKPMRVVAGISPVEAMRYRESRRGSKGTRKKMKTPGVAGMTFANLSCNRKRTVFTIVSMGLSCVLFVVLANFLGNMDMEYEARRYVEYGQFLAELDYSMEDEAYPENNLDHILENNPLNEELEEAIWNIDGVTDVKREQILYAEGVGRHESSGPYTIRVVDRDLFERLKAAYKYLGEFDYDTVSAQNAAVFGYLYGMEDYGFSLGDQVEFKLYDGAEKKNWKTNVAGAFGYSGGLFTITEDTFYNLGLTGNTTNRLYIDCREEDTEKVQAALFQLLSGKEHISLESYQDTLEMYQDSVRVMEGIGYILCLLISFISFMNMANTIITSIVTRKREFGVLQAIGMTNRQLNRSLQMEGIILTAGTSLVSLLVGLPLGYGLFRYGKWQGLMGLNVYHLPIAEILLMMVLLGGLQMGLSFILSRNLKKESVVERIRHQE